MNNVISFSEIKFIEVPRTKIERIDLKSTDFGVTGLTQIEVPMFKKPFKRRLKELFEKIF